jgi:hypothetical protein
MLLDFCKSRPHVAPKIELFDSKDINKAIMRLHSESPACKLVIRFD